MHIAIANGQFDTAFDSAVEQADVDFGAVFRINRNISTFGL
jgi:hypothetical protein